MVRAGVARRTVEAAPVPDQPAPGQRVLVGAPDELAHRPLQPQLRQRIGLRIAELTTEDEADGHLDFERSAARKQLRVRPRSHARAQVATSACRLCARARRSPERPLWSIVAMDPTVRRPARDLRLRRLPPRPGGRRARGHRPARARRARRHADRRGQVAVLPAARARARRPDARRLAARLAHAGPGRGAREDRARQGRARQRPAGRRHQPRCAASAPSAGELRLLYVAPERFSSAPFLQAIRDTKIGLFVVDEAHCVSQWGHDFRPDYFRLADAARWLQAEAIIASTATATPQVANDIVERLGLRDPVRVATGFDRPNLSFAVLPCASTQAKHRHIAAALAQPDATPAIVYAGTRAGGREARDEAVGQPRRRGRRLPRRARARAARRGAAPLHGRPPRRRRRDERLRHGDRQGRRAHGLPRVGAGLDRGLLPGGRARRPRRQARARAAVRRGARQGPARVLHPAQRGQRRGDLDRRAAPADALAGGPLRPRHRRARGGARRARRERRPGARRHRPPRARRRRAPGAVVARPPARADRVAVRRPRARGVPQRSAGEGTRARWAPVPRRVGVRRGRRVPARDDPAPLRRPQPARAAAGRAVLRRLRRLVGARRRRPTRAARGRPRTGAAAARRRRARATSTRRSSRSSRPRSRRSAARAPSRSCAAGARRRW